MLNLDPKDEFAGNSFWTSEENATLALTGVYRGNIHMNVKNESGATDWWSYIGLLFLEMTTDNVYDRRGDNSVFNKLTNGTLNSSSPTILEYWKLSYARIARCNEFLENIDKVPMSDNKKNRMKSEARFIRACQYFYLSQYWGSAPLVKKVLNQEQANTVPKASKKQIVQFVLEEINELVQYLPKQSELSSTEKGRATKQAALAFLGRLQMSEQTWADAVKTYETIINFGDNQIDPDFVGLFNGSNEASKEIIFATQFVANYASNAMQQHTYPAGLGGWHIHCPLGSLVESFEFNSGYPFSYDSARYDPLNVSKNRDPRLAYSILCNEQSFKNYNYICHPDSSKSVDQLTTSRQATRTGFGLRKFNSENQTGDLQNSGIDLPIIRYAEILLSYLEAKLESGQSIDLSLLNQTINKVRQRASVNMPAVTETNMDKLRVILRRERRNELAFEGLRLWDLFRWKTAEQVLNADFYGAPFVGATNLRKKAGQIDPYSRWYVTSKAFRATDYTWPIPQKEQDINPNLRN